MAALLAATLDGLYAIGSPSLQAIAEGEGRVARVAARAHREWRHVCGRLRAAGVTAFSAALVAAWLFGDEHGGLLGAAVGAGVVALAYAALAEVFAVLTTRRSSTMSLTLLRWLRPVEWLFFPVAAPLAWLAAAIGRLIPETPAEQSDRVAHLAVEHFIDEGAEHGVIAAEHAELLRSALEFEDTIAREVMVPRTQVIGFDRETPIATVLGRVVESGHSRYPVYREQLDSVEGVLYAKDLFGVLQSGTPADDIELRRVTRSQVFFVPETQKVSAVLREMQRRRSHMAIVVDEFGGTSGIVTLEDILEEIVGDIRDEHDVGDEPQVQECEPGRYLVDAGVSIADFEDLVGEEIPRQEGAFDTIGGMVIGLAGRVPSAGYRVRTGSFEVIVAESDERHVRRLEIVHEPFEPAVSV
ncbi:MAG: HlyC/CorC family transporter [Myxococcales bacterium]|nr:HlyC/CorC family transporter [Myxococcales bacterium]